MHLLLRWTVWRTGASAPNRSGSADGGLVSIQQLGNLSLIVSCFHKGVDLISFNLAEMFVGHGQLRLAGQEALNAKHPQPPSPQLIKVALRA